MREKVSTLEVRARLGDMLNRVALRHDEFVIERKGKPLAALVPVERLEQMRAYARLHAREFMQKRTAEAPPLTEEEAMKEALLAQAEARAEKRKPEGAPRRVSRKPRRSRK